jgi:hypothetical protein
MYTLVPSLYVIGVEGYPGMIAAKIDKGYEKSLKPTAFRDFTLNLYSAPGVICSKYVVVKNI